MLNFYQMNTKLFIFILPLYLLGVVYLILPDPSLEAIPGALRSTEPGDTWQNPDQQAYFTDQNRDQVLKHFQDTFSLKLLGINIPSYRLNYRPEDTATYVRGYIDSYYLEEIVHPLRESLFVNGWNPSLSPKYTHLSAEERSTYTIEVDGQIFQSKITIKPYYSSIIFRILIWTLIFPSTYFVFKNLFESSFLLIKSFKQQ